MADYIAWNKCLLYNQIMEKTYIAIDLKSFYASVECRERGLDPLNTNLVVADDSRTEKTICLAVSPSLKSFGIGGRARLFEVIERVSEVNALRKINAPGQRFKGKSVIYSELTEDPSLELDYIVAVPQMAHYMNVSAKIYGIYLKYVAPEDIFAYSIDEVFIDATDYLRMYKKNAHDLAMILIKDVLEQTGITATAGIGPNMYLCKVAMDIVAKHIPADKDGVRIASLDVRSYRETLWEHRPIRDFWRVGGGIAERLESLGAFTMGDVARLSSDEEHVKLLYDEFGKNAELLIDHAWGIEPTTIADVKAYRPANSSLSSGQVLMNPTDHEHTRLIVWEMADILSLDLVEKGLVTDRIVLTINYDRKNLDSGYTGAVTTDYYGRQVPSHAHGTINLDSFTSSTRKICDAAMELFDRITDRSLLSRRITIVADNVKREEDAPATFKQMSIFDMEEQQEDDGRERVLQEAVLQIKHKFGKNALLKGKNLTEGATARQRNDQIGGHRA